MKYQTVKCSEKLPEEDKYVFCICSAEHEDIFMAVCYYEDGEWYEVDSDDVKNKVISWLEPIAEQSSVVQPKHGTEQSQNAECETQSAEVKKPEDVLIEVYGCKDIDDLKQCFFSNTESLSMVLEAMTQFANSRNELVRNTNKLDAEEKDYSQSKSFWERLESFISDVETGCAMGEEEKEMILNVCEKKKGE